MWTTIQHLLLHLRVHFQLLLSSLFLWGFLLAAGSPDRRFLLAFLLFHVFLYGGATAYNSYYDRDQGPIGGLLRPPPVTRALLPFSLTIQLVGLGLAWILGSGFAILYLAMFLMGLAYSHPRVRLKSNPTLSVAMVSLGQGGFGFLGGWLTAGVSLESLAGAPGILGILSAVTMTTGLYPLTQVYQIEEDRRRGDRTFAVHWGPGGSFRFSLALIAASAVLMAVLIARTFTPIETGLMLLFFAYLALRVARWWRDFDLARVEYNYRQAMKLLSLSCLTFIAYTAFRLSLTL